MENLELDYSALAGKRVGYALTGSFCTFDQTLAQLEKMVATGAEVIPIFSDNVWNLDTRFFGAKELQTMVTVLTGKEIWHTLPQVEPIGPRKLLDLLVIAPATGNTLSKLAWGITDTPVCMAAKSQLRNGRPVVLAVSTNDALSGCARSIGQLMGTRNVYFVPFAQDDAQEKPTSMVADFDMVLPAALSALAGKQIQPILIR